MTVRTTFLTGMLANLVEEAVDLLVSRVARRDRTLFAGSRRPSVRRVGVLAGLWAGFVAGAVSGGLGEAEWHLGVMALPATLLVALILLDIGFPYGGPLDTPKRRRVQRWRSGE